MTNIEYYNIFRRMDMEINSQLAETADIVKNGYLCIENCYLHKKTQRPSYTKNTHLCKGKPGGICPYDLRSQFYK